MSGGGRGFSGEIEVLQEERVNRVSLEFSSQQSKALEVMIRTFPVSTLATQAFFLEPETRQNLFGPNVARHGIGLNPVDVAARKAA